MSITTEITRLQKAKINIKTAIESKGVTVGDGLIDTYADKIQDVYNAGKQAEYDAFWDEYQQNGNRNSYNNAFYNLGWNDKTFKPKYDIRPGANGNTATNIFQACAVTDMSKILEEQGVVIDLSLYKGSNPVSLFPSCVSITRIPLVIIPPTANYGNHCAYCYKLKTIDGLMLSEEGTQTFSNNIFQECYKLENITIVGCSDDKPGKIGNNFNIGASLVLTKESILSIINALLETASGKTVTFSKTAINNAFGINIDNESTYTEEWNTLRNSKSNWNFSFA